MYWLIGRCVGLLGDVLAYWEICWLIGRFVGSLGDFLACREILLYKFYCNAPFRHMSRIFKYIL